MEEPLSGLRYAAYFVDFWQEIQKLNTEYTQTKLDNDGEADREITHKFIASLRTAWMELSPKLKGRVEFKALSEEFEKYRPYIRNPKMLSEAQNDEKIMDMYLTIRECVEELKITSFGEG